MLCSGFYLRTAVGKIVVGSPNHWPHTLERFGAMIVFISDLGGGGGGGGVGGGGGGGGWGAFPG